MPVILPPGPPLPVHAGLVLLDQTHREILHGGAEDRSSFRLEAYAYGTRFPPSPRRLESAEGHRRSIVPIRRILPLPSKLALYLLERHAVSLGSG